MVSTSKKYEIKIAQVHAAMAATHMQTHTTSTAALFKNCESPSISGKVTSVQMRGTTLYRLASLCLDQA